MPTPPPAPAVSPDRPVPEAERPSLAADRPSDEAARYALLRRLAPSLRHEAVAHLQPLAMIGGVLERRLRAPAPALEPLREDAARLTELTRAALLSCLDLVGWLAPDGGRRVPLHEAVADTVTLLRGSLGFRGFSLRDEMGGLAEPVAREPLRHLLPACVLWLTDSAGAPAEITLSARVDGPVLRLHLALQPTEGPAAEAPAADARPLSLAEVQALADHEGIAFAQEGDAIVLTLAGQGLAAP